MFIRNGKYVYVERDIANIYFPSDNINRITDKLSSSFILYTNMACNTPYNLVFSHGGGSKSCL